MSQEENAGRVSIPLQRELDVVIKWKNARAVIRQLRNNEWDFRCNSISDDFLTATRKGRELWIGTQGAWFLDVDKSNAFGLLLRHYVYWAAAYWKQKECRKKKWLRKTPKLYED